MERGKAWKEKSGKRKVGKRQAWKEKSGKRKVESVESREIEIKIVIERNCLEAAKSARKCVLAGDRDREK